jgi:argininosuccinate synthase
MKKKKVVLAYSGGLDTSVCIPWLMDRGYEVVCFMADVGQNQDSSGPVKRGKIAGASKVIVEDLKQEFIENYIWPALKANAVYENRYPLATALSRPLIAQALVRAAQRENATAVAHGCTGKGNDQVRIEMSVRILDPKLEIIAPVREWDLKSRDAEIEYAKERKIPIDVTKKSPYSIDQNLWGVSIECGVLENPWTAPPADCYLWTKGAETRNPKPEELVIGFDSGIPVSVNGKKMPAMELIRFLNEKAAHYGIGRVDMVENRYVGIKSREVYESPAATILLAAHRDLESMVLDRAVSSFKDELSKRYAEMIYQGYWFTELKSCFDAMIERTQGRVTGEVRVILSKNNASVTGRKSKYSLYKEALATYTEKDQFDQSLAKGFIELVALPYVGQGVKKGK